jgi:6-phosphogluconolactonase
MLTRRRLLALLPATAFYAHLPNALAGQTSLFKRRPRLKAELPHPLVFFGCDTARPAAKGIYRAHFDPNTGRFDAPALAAECLRPAYMAMNEVQPAAQGKIRPAAQHVMYVCNEGDANSSAISTYKVDPISGNMTKLGQVSAGFAGPCYVAVDSSGHSAYVADYAGGGVASYSVRPDGTLTEPVDRVDFHNTGIFRRPGPVKARQDGPHPHSSMLSPDDRFIVVNDLGNDDIAIFPIDRRTAHLGAPHLYTNLKPGSGPRHLAFHPNGRWAYGIDEIANRIDPYLYTSMHGGPGVEAQALLSAASRSVSTVDPGFRGVNTAAEIAIAPTGDFLYASNRGEDSLVVFAISPAGGALTLVQRIACGGRTPRHFTLDRTGNWIICGNQDSASVTVFARNPASGRLSGPVQTVPLESPMFTLFS